MNLIPKIAEMLGVKIGERFEVDSIDHANGIYYYFSETELLEHRKDRTPDYAQYRILADLIYGYKKVVKLPFEPKYGEKYWTVYWKEIVDRPCALYEIWYGDSIDFANKVSGNCFRTEAEAEKHKHEIYEKLTGKKWGEGAK